MAREAEVGAGGVGGGIILGPAPISQELSFLVVYVFSAEDLPRFSAVGDPSINAVVQVGIDRTICNGTITEPYHTLRRSTVGE